MGKLMFVLFLGIACSCSLIGPGNDEKKPLLSSGGDTIQLVVNEGTTAIVKFDTGKRAVDDLLYRMYVKSRYTDANGTKIEYFASSELPLLIVRGDYRDSIEIGMNVFICGVTLFKLIVSDSEGSTDSLYVNVTIQQPQQAGFAPLVAGNTWTYLLDDYHYCWNDSAIRTISVLSVENNRAEVIVRDSFFYVENDNGVLLEGSRELLRTYHDTCIIADSGITSRILGSYFPRDRYLESMTTLVTCGGIEMRTVKNSRGTYYANFIETNYLQYFGLVYTCTSYHGGGTHTTLLSFNGVQFNIAACPGIAAQR